MKATPTSSILTFFAFLFNCGAVYVLTLMLPFGMSINVWFKILLAFLLTTGEVLQRTVDRSLLLNQIPSRVVTQC